MSILAASVGFGALAVMTVVVAFGMLRLDRGVHGDKAGHSAQV